VHVLEVNIRDAVRAGREADHPGPSSLAEGREQETRVEQVAEKVGGELLLKAIRGMAQRDGRDSRVVDEHIQFGLAGRELLGGLAYSGQDAKIKREKVDAGFRIGAVERLDGLLAAGPIMSRKNHFRVCREQRAGLLVADATARPGNQDRFSAQITTRDDVTRRRTGPKR